MVSNGVVPDVAVFPPPGCFCLRCPEKIERADFKLDAQNEPGVLSGFGHLENTFGTVILVKQSLVVARHINKTRVDAIHRLFLSVIRMKSAIQAYTADLQHPPAELRKSRHTSEDKGSPYVITHKPTYHPPNPQNPTDGKGPPCQID
jgi:hypothetical protein